MEARRQWTTRLSRLEAREPRAALEELRIILLHTSACTPFDVCPAACASLADTISAA